MKLNVNSSKTVDQLDYTSTLGSMMYVMNYTPREITLYVSKMSQYIVNLVWNTEHRKIVGRVLGYLKRTSTLTYTSSCGMLEGCYDANWVNHTSGS